jgi:hypothetical protein
VANAATAPNVRGERGEILGWGFAAKPSFGDWREELL